MSAHKYSAGGTAATALIVEVFRLNGRLLDAGDSLVEDIGLTSARWQVLGAMAESETPQPVAHIARTMGLTRQAVQRIANDLEQQGLIRFAPNPHHERAKLAVMTDAGRRAFETAMERQAPWANKLGKGIRLDDLATAVRVLQEMRSRLESNAKSERQDRGSGP